MKSETLADEEKQAQLTEPEWVWGLIGNIVEEHEYGEAHEIRRGTKQFRAGTKVFLSCSHWGMAMKTSMYQEKLVILADIFR